jgi:hypothetical protein
VAEPPSSGSLASANRELRTLPTLTSVRNVSRWGRTL